MVAVPTSNICTMCGALPARNAAIAATMGSGYQPLKVAWTWLWPLLVDRGVPGPGGARVELRLVGPVGERDQDGLVPDLVVELDLLAGDGVLAPQAPTV